MKFLLRPLARVFLFFVFGTPAAALANGDRLLEACTQAERMLSGEPLENIQVGYCVGVVTAVRDTMYEYNESAHKNARLCPPPTGLSNAEAIRVVLKFLRNAKPEYLNEEAARLTILAYLDAFKCK